MGSIEERRSIRRFQGTVLDREIVETVLRAGLQAPSPKNRQPWRFVVISDAIKKREFVTSMREEIARLSEEKPDRADIPMSLETMDVIEQAPVLILVCYACNLTEHHDDGVNWEISARDLEAVELQSIGAAVENMLLKAEEMGIGSLWCADILYAYGVVSKYASFPVVSAVCLGYKDEMPKARDRYDISELCSFDENGLCI